MSSGELDDAVALENSGQAIQAIQVYQTWLNENRGNERYTDVLIHSASLYENPIDSLNLLKLYSSGLFLDDSYKIYARIAGLESSLGLLQNAAMHYTRASGYEGSEGEQWLYSALSIRFSMGEYAEVRIEALNLAEEAVSEIVRDEAAALAAVCLALSSGDGNTVKDALGEINRYINKHSPVQSPLTWFALHYIAMLDGNPEGVNHAMNILSSQFPASIVNYLVDSRVPEWVSPASYLFIPQSISIQSVQVGAFSRRDAASALRLRLEDDHVIAWIEQNGNLWRVIVNDPAGDAISRLKASGYDVLF